MPSRQTSRRSRSEASSTAIDLLGVESPPHAPHLRHEASEHAGPDDEHDCQGNLDRHQDVAPAIGPPSRLPAPE